MRTAPIGTGRVAERAPAARSHGVQGYNKRSVGICFKRATSPQHRAADARLMETNKVRAKGFQRHALSSASRRGASLGASRLTFSAHYADSTISICREYRRGGGGLERHPRARAGSSRVMDPGSEVLGEFATCLRIEITKRTVAARSPAFRPVE